MLGATSKIHTVARFVTSKTVLIKNLFNLTKYFYIVKYAKFFMFISFRLYFHSKFFGIVLQIPTYSQPAAITVVSNMAGNPAYIKCALHDKDFSRFHKPLRFNLIHFYMC